MRGTLVAVAAPRREGAGGRGATDGGAAQAADHGPVYAPPARGFDMSVLDKTAPGRHGSMHAMSIDMNAARDFMATHARILDRRRFELLDGGTDTAGALAALDGYRNPDGGYGWGLEGDLRSPESQPAAALHAFEVFAEAGPAPQAAALCRWLDEVTLPDGGLPMALPVAITAGSGPWWAGADPGASSLQITSVVAARAWRAAGRDPAIADHPWLGRATDYTLAAIERLESSPGGYVLAFCIQFLDAVHAERPEAQGLLERMFAFVPADGHVPVHGGEEDETLRPLDLAPDPDGAARRLLEAAVIDADLERLAAGQQEDGGWTVDFVSRSPAGKLDWRGYATVDAVDVLTRNGRS